MSAHLRHCFRKTMTYRRTMDSVEDIYAPLTFIHEKRAFVSVRTRMVSFNNTSASLTIGLSPLEHQPFNCVGDMKIWLFAHFVTSRCVLLFSKKSWSWSRRMHRLCTFTHAWYHRALFPSSVISLSFDGSLKLYFFRRSWWWSCVPRPAIFSSLRSSIVISMFRRLLRNHSCSSSCVTQKCDRNSFWMTLKLDSSNCAVRFGKSCFYFLRNIPFSSMFFRARVEAIKSRMITDCDKSWGLAPLWSPNSCSRSCRMHFVLATYEETRLWRWSRFDSSDRMGEYSSLAL